MHSNRRFCSLLRPRQYSFHEQYGVGLDPDELEYLWFRLQILGACICVVKDLPLMISMASTDWMQTNSEDKFLNAQARGAVEHQMDEPMHWLSNPQCTGHKWSS